MQHQLRLARINIKVLVILAVVLALGGGGFVGAHYIRKNAIAKAALAAGNTAYEKQDWVEAIKQYRLYLSKYPESPDVLERLALASLAAPDTRPDYLQNAIMSYRRLLRMRNDDADLYRRLVKLYFQVGDFDEANYIAGNWVSQHPGDPEAREWEARAQRELRRSADALQSLQQFFSDPATAEAARKHVRLHAIIAELYLSGDVPPESSNKSREQSAFEWVDRAVKDNPQSVEALVQRARVVAQLRTRSGAALSLREINLNEMDPRADLAAASELKSPDLKARLQLAQTWYDLRDLARANAELEAIESLKHPEYQFDFERLDVLLLKHQLRARVLIESSRQQADTELARSAGRVVDAALADLNDSRRRIHFLPAAVNLCLLANRDKQAEELLTQYEAAVGERTKGNPELTEQIACLRAMLANKRNDYFRAIQELEAIVRLGNVRDPDVWMLLGYSYTGSGQERRAIQALERYRALRPLQGDMSVAVDLAKLHYRLGEWTSVRRLTGELERTVPENLDVRLMRIESTVRMKPGEAELSKLLEEVRTLAGEHKDRPELPLLEAMILSDLKRPQEAIARLQQAEGTVSNPAAITLQLLEFHIAARDHDAAIAAARRAIERQPNIGVHYVTLAQALSLAGKNDEAKQALRDGAEHLRTASEEIGRKLAGGGDPAEAARLQAEQRRLLNESRRARLALARFLKPAMPSATQPSDTLQELEESIPGEKYAEMIAELDRLVAEYPDEQDSSPQAEEQRRSYDLNLLIQVYRELLQLPPVYQKADRAARLVQSIRQVEGERGIWWRYEEARLAARSKSWKSKPELVNTVKGRLAEITELDPGFADVVLWLGAVYVELGESDRAADLYRRFLDQNTQDDRVVVQYVHLLRMQRRDTEARRVLDRVQVRGRISTYRAVLAIGQNDVEGALRQLESHVTANPRDVQARVLLAESIHRRDKDTAAALRELDEAERLAPGSLFIAISRAGILDAAGRTDEAIEFLNSYVEKHKNYDSYLLRGEFFVRKGRHAEAEKDFEQLTRFEGLASRGHLRLGLFHEDNRDFNKAIEAYRSGIQKTDEDSTERRELQYALVRVLTESGIPENLNRAAAILDNEMPGNPVGRDATRRMSLRASLLMRRGQEEAIRQAIELYEQVVSQDKYDVAAHVQLIQHAMQKRNYARAVQLADQAIGANPDRSELQLVKAMIESQVGSNRTAARDLVQSVLENEPHNVLAVHLLSLLNLQDNNIEAAEALHAKAVQLAPEHEDTKIMAARLLDVKGRRAEAIALLEAYRGSSEVAARSPKMLLYLADLYRADKKYDACEALLKTVESIDPRNASVYELRLQVLADQRLHADIWKLLGRRLAVFPEDGAALLAAAQHLAGSGENALITRAIADVEQFLQKHPQSVEAHLAIAQLAYRARNVNRAIQAYRSILGIDSFHREALNNLAWILSEEVDTPDREEALRHATRGVLQYNDDPSLLNTRGIINFRLGRLEDAQRDLEQCLMKPRLAPGTEARTRICLAKIARQRGDEQRARDYLQKAHEVDRKHQALTPAERKELADLLGQSLSKN